MTTVLIDEINNEIRGIRREPAALGFSIVFPVAMFLLFVAMWGDQPGDAGLKVGTTMLATFGTFGALAVCFFTPGLSVADARDRGWLRVKRVSPTPLPITLAAKVAACIPYVAAVLAVMAIAAQLTGTLDASPTAVVRLIAVLLLGALPFALVSLAIGFRTSPNAGVAVMQALLFPMVIASGLWFPLEVLPAPVAAAAPYLPTYHLAQLALAQLSGAAVTTHVLALVAMAVIGGVAAIASYRTARL
jgi:ABC-2 type transport system permease protein